MYVCVCVFVCVCVCVDSAGFTVCVRVLWQKHVVKISAWYFIAICGRLGLDVRFVSCDLVLWMRF